MFCYYLKSNILSDVNDSGNAAWRMAFFSTACIPHGRAARICNKEALARGIPRAEQVSLRNKWLILAKNK